MYKFAICLRYLARRRISLFPVAGVALGVMTFVVILSLGKGFEAEFASRLRETTPDLTIYFFRVRPEQYKAIDEILAAIESVPEVRSAAPFAYGRAVALMRIPSKGPLGYSMRGSEVFLLGCDFSRGGEVYGFTRFLKYGDCFGTPGVRDTIDGGPALVVGALLGGGKPDGTRPGEADWGLVDRGDRVQLTNFKRDGTLVRRVGTVVDVFKSGLYYTDTRTVLVPLEWVSLVEGAKTTYINGIAVRLETYDEETVAGAKKSIAQALGPFLDADKLRIYSWEEELAQMHFLDYWANYRRIMAVILSCLVMVAGFTTAAVLFMTVLQKTRDIAILRAMGASARGIGAAFFSYGLAIGIAGAVLGLVFGIVVLHNIELVESGFYALTGFSRPAELELDHIPWILDLDMALWAAGIAVGVSFLAGLLPAVKAAHLNPVEAINRA